SVEGSDAYSVGVTLKDGEITDCSCDCPYDWGEYCKHLVAVFYALRDGLKTARKAAVSAKPKPPKLDLAEILQKADKPALIAIITEIAEENSFIKDKILLKFSDDRGMAERARSLIKSAVKRAMRRGFVEYADVDSAVEGAEAALKLAEKQREAGNLFECAEICVIVAEEMMDLMNSCDDSDGTAGGMISEAISLISDMTGNIPEGYHDADKLLKRLMSHADSKIYDGWTDWRMDILAACVPLCGDSARRGTFESYFTRMRMKGDENEWGRRYAERSVQRIALSLISRFDGPERAEAFMAENLDNPDFRREFIEMALRKGNPAEALKLCLEGEAADAEYPGLVSEWKKYRYTAYERLNDIPGQKTLAEEFLKGGSFEYYEKFKAIYTAGEWPGILNRLLDDLEKNPHGAYTKILIQEDLKPRLLLYCHKYLNTLPQLYKHLLPDYKSEVGEMFKKIIAAQAGRASNRRDYKDVCGVIKHYGTACGKAAAKEIKLALMEKYPRRPAFIDELNKV
ncbi:MAG: SWIM zinc finger domain-containing protein, partial [Clostridiales bacterium]|nr:SWIM zinc finger domain-containing protein [Clostridiales bacterium]